MIMAPGAKRSALQISTGECSHACASHGHSKALSQRAGYHGDLIRGMVRAASHAGSRDSPRSRLSTGAGDKERLDAIWRQLGACRRSGEIQFLRERREAPGGLEID